MALHELSTTLRPFSSLTNPIDPCRACSAVYEHGRLLSFDTSKLAKDICCPMCGGNSGYLVVPDNAWSCRNSFCISMNARSSAPKNQISPVKTETSLVKFGTPIELDYASLTNIHQNATHKQAIIDWTSDPKGFLVLAGTSGLGKTYSACALMQNALSQRKSVHFVSVSSLYLEVLGAQKEQKIPELIYRYVTPDLLVLDDLGVRTPSDFFLEILYLLINARYDKAEGSTIITTNMTAKDMHAKFGSALVSRIISGKSIKFTGIDKRKLSF